MYNQQTVKSRIKYQCELNGITSKKLLSDLDYNINLLTQAGNDRGLSGVALYRIADYLGVSVDYLLGRTDNPVINK